MVPYGTAAFVAPGEGDGAENASGVAGRRSIPVGTDGFSYIEHLLGAKEGAIVGFTCVSASMPGGPGDDEVGSGGLEKGKETTTSARLGSRKKANRKIIETEMAAGLNSCGWEKVRREKPYSINNIVEFFSFFLLPAMLLFTSIELGTLNSLCFLPVWTGEDTKQRPPCLKVLHLIAISLSRPHVTHRASSLLAQPSNELIPFTPENTQHQISVDFGGVVPFSHNKICALSRDRLTRALFGSGKKIMENAADFLIDNDGEDQEAVGRVLNPFERLFPTFA